MSESHPLHTAIEWILTPIGGLGVAMLFTPMGCQTADFICPPGAKTNFLGWTMGGLVGGVDGTAQVFIGLASAGLCWFVLHTFFASDS
jgi:hypothetical protein